MVSVHTISFLSVCLSLVQSTAVPFPRCLEPKFPVAAHVIPLYPPFTPSNGFFSADITVGFQTLRAALDTGSSDTWFLTQNANCTEIDTLQPVAPSECGFSGLRYTPDGTFEQDTNSHLNDSYGNTEQVTGPLGHTKLMFGGITIPKQAVGGATYASLGGNPAGNISGIIGLAYPSLTSAFPGTDPSKDTICTNKTDPTTCGPIPYSPLLSTIFSSNLTAPLFAFALSRGTTTGGTMTIGGIPRLHEPHINVTASAAPLIATVPIEPYANATSLSFYTASSSGFHYPNSLPNAGQGQYLIDSGTYPNILPRSEADLINALFDPPATFNSTGGYYSVPCEAAAPPFGVELGGEIFYHNPKDMIIPVPGQSQLCLSAIQASTAAVFVPILGATFMKNVLAVFDVGNTEITFVSRMYYEEECS